MTIRESQRSASQKWDRANMTVIVCRITKKKAAAFRAACQKLGRVPNQILLKLVDDTIKEAEEQEGRN